MLKVFINGTCGKSLSEEKATNATTLTTAATNNDKDQSSDPWVHTVSK